MTDVVRIEWFVECHSVPGSNLARYYEKYWVLPVLLERIIYVHSEEECL